MQNAVFLVSDILQAGDTYLIPEGTCSGWQPVLSLPMCSELVGVGPAEGPVHGKQGLPGLQGPPSERACRPVSPASGPGFLPGVLQAQGGASRAQPSPKRQAGAS